MFTSKLRFVMYISIHNLGIVETAQIDLDGITVLTGYNDSGKSFIGKMLYSIINTIKNALSFDEGAKIQQITYNLERISIAARRVVPKNVLRSGYTFTSDSLHVNLINHLVEYRLENVGQFLILFEQYKREIFLELEDFNEKNSRIKKEDLASMRKDIENQFEVTEVLLKAPINEEEIYLHYFQTVIINGMFDGRINTIGNESELIVTIIEGSTVLVNISISKNRINSFMYNTQLPLFKEDCVLIETPTIFSLDKYFYPIVNSTFRDRELPLHWHDLLLKIRVPSESSPIPFLPEAMEEIKNIINGDITYENSERSYVYTRKGDQKIASSNIATGIKSFGLLQMLLRNGYLEPDIVLILDEPEVHLHPAWEIEYAKLLFTLSKAGVIILMTTHSIYFIEALVKYSKDYEMEDKLRFYFSEKNDRLDATKFREVTNDLDPIFKALSKSMRDIL